MEPPSIHQIPYEKQEEAPGEEKCGAAALCMVLRSFDLACTQAEVWPAISHRGWRSRLARTHFLCREALGRGLEALIVHAAAPRAALERCAEINVRVIVNHRASAQRAAGHYSVLAGVDAVGVHLHDPQLGPKRRLNWAEMLGLWRAAGAEVPGHIFIAVGRDTPCAWTCPRCAVPVPESITCPCCAGAVRLRPAAVLGCVDQKCDERLWSRLFCPACDFGITALPAN